MGFERRLVPVRDNLAARHLSEFHEGTESAVPRPARVSGAVVDLRPRPDNSVVADTQLLFGETITVFDEKDGWVWLQAVDDGYTGYARASHVTYGAGETASHRVATLGTNVYASPSLKSPILRQLPYGAQVRVHGVENGYARIGEAEWLPEQHLVAIDHAVPDWVSVAEMFLGVPYLWGGRSNWGLDCSALIQLARQAAGRRCLRDSDMQQASEGESLPEDAKLQRGDLLFWRGHVGVMADPETLLHANGHHMAVVREPVDLAIVRILKAENIPVTRRARLS